jgi:hypothetical protein
MLRNVKRWTAVAALTAFAAAVAYAAAADGKWTWMQRGGQGGGEVAVVLELKADGEKLTGTLTRGDMKSEIKEGTIKGADLAFVTIRERDGQQFKTNYKGKLDADKIVGTIINTIQGQERTREWTATRAK